MRTLVLVAIGMLLAYGALRLAPAARRRLAAGGFALAWLLVVLWNLRTGLAHGYTLQEELPIHALLFAVPVALAAWLAFRARGN